MNDFSTWHMHQRRATKLIKSSHKHKMQHRQARSQPTSMLNLCRGSVLGLADEHDAVGVTPETMSMVGCRILYTFNTFNNLTSIGKG